MCARARAARGAWRAARCNCNTSGLCALLYLSPSLSSFLLFGYHREYKNAGRDLSMAWSMDSSKQLKPSDAACCEDNSNITIKRLWYSHTPAAGAANWSMDCCPCVTPSFTGGWRTITLTWGPGTTIFNVCGVIKMN